MEKVNIALDKKLFDLGIEYPHNLNLNSSSWLLCGASGSGKTSCNLHLLNNIITCVPDSRIWVCDGKHDDFKWLQDIPNSRYFPYLDMSLGLDSFHNDTFAPRLKNETDDRSHAIIVLEEFSSVLKVLEANKTTAPTAKIMLSQAFAIASMGRSYNCHLLVVVQRPSADVLQNFREQLTSILALGRLSPEVAKMCGFTEYDNFNNEESGRGVGWYLNDKNRLIQVKIPHFKEKDFARFKENIIIGVTR